MSIFRKTTFRVGAYLIIVLLIPTLPLVSGCSDSGDSNPTDANDGGGNVLRAKWNGTDGIGALFAQKCTPCHISENQGEYNLSTYANALDRRIKPFNPDNSLLVKKLEGDPDFPEQMPPGGPYLSTTQIDTIKAWIDAGALEN